jgi:hypothetical protein
VCRAATGVATAGESAPPAGMALAYFDCFWLFAVAMLAVTLVVFLMKRSVAEKGTRIGGE